MNEARRYRVLGAVGRGGFGTVYRAELLGESGFTKLVALKVLNADMADVAEIAGRLRDEARVLGLLRHRAIVQVDGLVHLEGRWTVVMEYVEGVDLKQLIAEVGAVPPGPALEIVAETAGALHVAYTRVGADGRPLCLLHRDIKPSNIQVTSAGETKLLDFGVARADFSAREAETRSLMFGSVGYMSPERLDFLDGPEGDVYALGSVLFELLGGVSFGKTSSKESRHVRRLDEALLGLRAIQVEEPLVELVGELMAYDPRDRPLAREVERRCNELRRSAGAPFLRDWAEGIIPPLITHRRDLDDDLSGATLVEQSGSSPAGPGVTVRPQVTAPMTPVPRLSDSGLSSRPIVRTAGVLAVLGIVGVLGILVTGAVVWFAMRSSDEGALASAPPVRAPAPVLPVRDGAVDAAPADETLGLDGATELAESPRSPVAAGPARAPTRARTSATRDEATTGAATTAAAPTAPAPDAKTGKVVVTGDATSVYLVSNGVRHAAGVVPAGSYTIEATFGSAAPIGAGSVQVLAGSEITLQCRAVFTRCSPR